MRGDCFAVRADVDATIVEGSGDGDVHDAVVRERCSEILLVLFGEFAEDVVDAAPILYGFGVRAFDVLE
jgi:hypothetical protein